MPSKPLSQSKLSRALYIVAGFVFVGLGALGVVLPVMPTTIFVILAAGCFAKSSPRFERWLIRNRTFGPFLINYRTKAGITMRHKVVTIIWLWTGLITSAVLVSLWWVRFGILPAVGIGVTWHVLAIKTREPGAMTPEQLHAAYYGLLDAGENPPTDSTHTPAG